MPPVPLRKSLTIFLLLLSACDQQPDSNGATSSFDIRNADQEEAENAAAAQDAENASNALVDADLGSSQGSGGGGGSGSGSGGGGPAGRSNTSNSQPPKRTSTTPSKAPFGLLPSAFQGDWIGLKDRCGDRSAELGLSIFPGELRFYESIGKVTRIEIKGRDTLLVTAAFEGEGQSWTKRQSYRLTDNGTRLAIWDDETPAVVRKRCTTVPTS